MNETEQLPAEEKAKAKQEAAPRILYHTNIEKMDPEEWNWRRRRAEERDEIW